MTVDRREEEQDPSQQSTDATAVWPFLRFDSPPRKIYHFFQQFRNGVENPSNYNNFLKGVKWSPDGTCFLTSCDDNTVQLFHLWDSWFFHLLQIHILVSTISINLWLCSC